MQINTQQEHAKAMKRISDIWDMYGDDMPPHVEKWHDELVDAVVMYEEKNFNDLRGEEDD